MSQAHPTDEQLSAALDGQDDGAEAHAAECPSCQARQDELRSVIALVAAPVPVDDAVREAAVAAALSAPVVPIGSASGARADVGVGFGADGGGGAGGANGAGAGAERRRINWAPIVAIAAVFVLGLLAVPRLISDDNDGDTATMSSKTGGAPEFADERGGIDGGDLGDVRDGLALRERIQPVLGGGDDFGADAAGGPTAGEGATEDNAAPTAQPAPVSGRALAGGDAQEPAACSGVVRQEYGAGIASLVYTADVRWNGTPAVVLAYTLSEPSERLRHRVFVLATDDCTLLNSLSL